MPTTIKTPGRIHRFDRAIGDVVFHRLASERSPGLITGIYLTPDAAGYYVTWSDRMETRHYECELTSEYVPDYAGE